METDLDHGTTVNNLLLERRCVLEWHEGSCSTAGGCDVWRDGGHLPCNRSTVLPTWTLTQAGGEKEERRFGLPWKAETAIAGRHVPSQAPGVLGANRNLPCPSSRTQALVQQQMFTSSWVQIVRHFRVIGNCPRAKKAVS